MAPENAPLSAARREAFRDVLLAAGLFAAVLVAYFPARNGGQLLDDHSHITRPELQSLAGLGRIWFEVGATQQYYPIVHTAFWLEHRLWGDAVAGYHLANVLLHAFAALLVVALMRRLRLPGAWLAAFLFALHPMCVESVAWIAEQKNTLSTVFYLLAALAYLRWRESQMQFEGEVGPGGRARPCLYFQGTAFFILALLSKSVTVTLPATLLIVFWWQTGRLVWKRDVQPLLAWFALGGAVSLVTFSVEHGLVAGVGVAFPLSGVGRVLLAGRAFWFYLAKLFWPAGLTFFYPRWTVDPAVGWQYLYPLAAAALGAGLWLLARSRRGPLAAFLCFAGTLAPVLGFFNVEWFVFSYVADHLQYLACLAVIIPVAAVVTAGAARMPLEARWLAPMAAGGAAVALGILTWRQCGRYADPVTFYRTAAALNPMAAAAHDNLGTVLAATPGRLPEAIAEFDQAIQIQPDLPGAYYNRGSAYLRVDRLAEATADLEQALRLQPGSPDVLTNLGVALARSGRLPEAIARYEGALRIDPGAPDTRLDLARARFQLGSAFAGQRRWAMAAGQLAEAVRLEPDYLDARVNLGNLLFLQGRVPEAIVQYEAALLLRPGDGRILELLNAARAGPSRP
jgi:tetratricopeptide (TPR) repeat protein